MNVSKVKITRKYNLGGYETLDVGYEAVLSETEGANHDSVLKATADLEKLADMYYQMGRFQKEPAPEKPKLKEPKEEKTQGVIVNLEELTWEPMPATGKGPWEKAQVTTASPYPFIKEAIETKGRPVYMDGYIVWLNKDESLGRRKK